MDLNAAPYWTKTYTGVTVYKGQTYQLKVADGCTDTNGDSVSFTAYVDGQQVT